MSSKRVDLVIRHDWNFWLKASIGYEGNDSNEMPPLQFKRRI
ncbi:hypothetical protein [Scytonema sp. NUACC21]